MSPNLSRYVGARYSNMTSETSDLEVRRVTYVIRVLKSVQSMHISIRSKQKRKLISKANPIQQKEEEREKD